MDLLTQYGLLAVFLVMLAKEAGVPVPVPSDLIMITAGIQSALGLYNLPELAVAVVAAVVIGGSLQFLLVRKVGRALIYRVGCFVGLTPSRLDSAAATLERRGPGAVFVGLNLPAARAGIITAAALTRMGYASFALPMVAGGAVYYGWHIALGYVAGPSAAALLERAQLPLLGAVVGLALLGLVAWLLLRRRRGAAAPEQGTLDRIHAWTEAACPACLAASIVQLRRETDGG